MWVTLGSILNKLTDGTHKTPKYTSTGVKFVSVKDMSNGFLSLENTKYISEEEHKELYARCNPEKGDLILSKVGTTGVPAIVDTTEPFSLFVSVALLKFDCKCIDIEFLYYMLMSPLVQAQATENTRGVGNKNWVLDAIASTMVVLPPLVEQKRIVAKIEELLPLVDRYAVSYEKLEQFNAKFPEDMKKSILQYAIQGKLVEQREEEGTGEELYRQIQAEKKRLIKEGKIKKEKPLPEIAEDEIPFDIPESWKWVRIGALTYNWGQKTPDSRFCYIDVGSVNNTSHTLNKENTVVEAKDASSRAKKIVKKGDVIFATIRPYLKNICIIDKNFPCEPIASTAFAVMHCPEGLLNKYLYYYLLSPTFMRFANARDKAKGVAYPAIGEKDFFNGIIALPPVAEQKRIVAKLEEILPLCERLK